MVKSRLLFKKKRKRGPRYSAYLTQQAMVAAIEASKLNLTLDLNDYGHPVGMPWRISRRVMAPAGAGGYQHLRWLTDLDEVDDFLSIYRLGFEAQRP